MAFDFTYPGTPPSRKRWGPGAPNCQTDKVVPLVVPTSHGDIPFVGGVRREAEELFRLVLAEVDRRGYKLKTPGCWGGACRMTKRADGSLTDTPSVHSWYLAVDINAPTNAFGGSHDIPRWVAKLMHDYGFRWLGPPIGDWMHFDFCGSPLDCKRMTEKARRNFPPHAFVYKGTRYLSLKRLLEALRRRLQNSKPGEKHEIDVRPA
jgi:hypothetical protein